MRKNFVLDTNVLLHDPRAMFHFADNNVVIPIYVIEEIDTFKKDQSELGRNARQVARLLDELRSRRRRLSDGAPLPQRRHGAGRAGDAPAARPLRDSPVDGPAHPRASRSRCATPTATTPTILVTKDVNLRIRADALGLHADGLRGRADRHRRAVLGQRELAVAGADVDTFYAAGRARRSTGRRPARRTSTCCCAIATTRRTARSAASTAPARSWCRCKKLREGVWGIRPRNKEQHFALDLLLNDDIKLVTLVGKAGTGKTLLAHRRRPAEGASRSRRLLRSCSCRARSSRSARDIGYLPGDIEEKLNPWMQPIYDNVELLLGLVEDRTRRTAAATRS